MHAFEIASSGAVVNHNRAERSPGTVAKVVGLPFKAAI
jgi:hypothetical protein